MAALYHTFGHSKQDKNPPLSERLCAKAMVAAYLGKGWRRYISFARVAARREEINQAVEAGREAMRKAARI